MAKCTKCGEEKSSDLFHKNTSISTRHCSTCKTCISKEKKQYYWANNDLIKTKNRKRRANNLEKYRTDEKKRYHNNENRRIQNNRWYAINKEKLKQWRIDHPDQVKAWNKKHDEKRRSTPKGRLNDNIRRRISKILRGTKMGNPWENIVGYALDKLKKHLEYQFKYDMTWDNYGKLWHIDHIIPISAFNFEKPEDIDFKKCWCLNNLQPLYKKENLSKNNKLKKPFQPSLII